ncbi:hypothetical protein SAMN04487867_10466 [Vreelandella titanicae]|uniref:hypothetical protein n=1 Tax=Vreelandella titanicae TaxID=664683 RepID=UPI00088ABB32|nr:hypothetical protein [Halomonas titanicae]SDI27929.1 hypothetical protein SAMN04487867_10466 [Halomonas titanicae]
MSSDDLVQDVITIVPEAPFMTIREALQWSARKFCTEADAWVTDEQPIIYGADSDYPMIVAPQGEPLRIVSLTLNGREVTQGEGFEQSSPTAIHFSQKPKESAVSGRLACRPKRGDMPPAEVTDRWSEPIADGATWRLLMMPQPWKNPELAIYYERRFLAGITDARQHSRLGHARGGARVKARRFI